MLSWLAEQYSYLIFAGLCILACVVQCWWLKTIKHARLPWLVWLLTAVLIWFGWHTAEQAGKREKTRVQFLMQDFAKLYGHEIEKAGHWRLPNEVSGNDPLYLELIETQKKWLKLNPDVTDIYTFRKLPNGKNILLVDSETDYNRNGSFDNEEREQRTQPGEIYGEVDEGLEKAFRGEANFEFVPLTDRWGTWVSAFVPLIDPTGRVDGVLGVDFEATKFAAVIANARWRVTGMVALLLVVLLASSTLNLTLRAQIAERKRAEVSLLETSALLETILNNTTDNIYFKDRASRFVYYSQALVKHVGLHHADALKGKTDFECFTEEHARPAFEQEQQVIQTGKSFVNLEEKETHLDGHTTWVLTSKIPWHDQNGNIIGTWGISKDITEIKHAQESLRLLSSALQQTSESVVITDADLDLPGPRIVFVNPAFSKMTGYTAEEVIGKNPRILQGPKSNRALLGLLREKLTRGESFEGETVNYRKDRTEFPIEWQIAPVKNTNGKTEHYVAIQRDITQRKLVEAQLIQSQKQETVGKLAAGIAHEFNNIMTVIIGHSDLLLSDLSADDPSGRSVDHIRTAARRAAQLTHQLLAYGRKQFLRSEILNLHQVLTGMETILRHLAGKNVALNLSGSDRLATVKADAGQIEQVIINLVMNAVDAMPEGGTLTIETTTVRSVNPAGEAPDLAKGDYVLLSIADTGIGMTEAVKARVFEPFFTTKDVGKGTGLGLATCHGIIKQSGGHITLSSTPGAGTTFRIYLPQAERILPSPVPSAMATA
jgi:PAS domain S-box-containing protein